MSDQMSEETEHLLRVPIDWHIPESVISRYATNFVVQHGEHEFTMLFFELQLPLLLGSDAEKARRAQELRSVEATCVARVVIAAERMEQLIGLLQQNLEAYRSRPEPRASE